MGGPEAHRRFKVKNPNWKKLQKIAKLQQSQKLVRVAQVSVAKDARRLAKTGSRVDLKVLNHDTRAAEKGQLTLSGPEKLILKKEQQFFDHMRRTRGEETLHDMKAGIKARAKREMKNWNKMRHVVENAGLPISYGASALHSLPERDDDPLMSDIMKQRFNGNTGLVTTPIRRDDPPGPLSSKIDPIGPGGSKEWLPDYGSTASAWLLEERSRLLIKLEAAQASKTSSGGPIQSRLWF